MCLAVITSRSIPSPPRFGYKVFLKNIDDYHSLYSFTRQQVFKENVWYVANTTEVLLSNYDWKPYKSGFHIFQAELAAERLCEMFYQHQCVVRKVEMAEIMVAGYEREQLVYVARRMKICA